MFRLSSRQVLDLLSARNPWGDILGFDADRFDGRREAAVADLRREIVMFFFKTEGAGHAAAARVDFTDFVASGFEHRGRRRGADQSFLMAVAMQQTLLTF